MKSRPLRSRWIAAVLLCVLVGGAWWVLMYSRQTKKYHVLKEYAATGLLASPGVQFAYTALAA